LQRSTSMAQKYQRDALVIVKVRITHRRSVKNQALIQQALSALLSLFHLVDEIGDDADVILVDRRKLKDALLGVSVMRSIVKSRADATWRENASIHITAHLE